ncbi:acylphosphatase [Kamptonema cortianum]|nr:acylphosphatase [Kamptonema cortianum]
MRAETAKQIAVQGIVTGTVQKVGFRAHILKTAIRYNLAGMTKNQDDGTVIFTLQGDSKRIERALNEIRAGTKKSTVESVTVTPAEFNPAINTFTVLAWTSHSRKITTPYDLIFTQRQKDDIISRAAAKKEFDRILETTIKVP